MPIKFKPTQRTFIKGTGKYVTQNFYMKSTSVDELVSVLNQGNTSPKRKQKIRNELVKRGV